MITIEDLRDGDEEAAYALGQQAFSGTAPYDPELPGMGEGRHVAAYLDGRIIGQVRRLEFRQCFGGRRLPCAGIAGVSVAPEARGGGLARRMLEESLRRAADDGEVIAALYPTTAALYRSAGFEVAGWWVQCSVPLRELPSDEGSVRWERAELGDERALALHVRMAHDHDGWVEPGDRFWRHRAIRARNDHGTNRYLYLGHREGEPVAAVQYAYGSSERSLYRVDAELVVGVDGSAVRAALAFLGANGTTADEVTTVLPVDELELHLEHAQRASIRRTWPWMLAFVDLQGAIAARGYPEAVSGSVPLAVHDTQRPGNDGSWVLSVEGGSGALEPGGDGRVEVASTDLAAVFTGHLDPVRLAHAGRLEGATTADIGFLRAAFAGSPSLTIFF